MQGIWELKEPTRSFALCSCRTGGIDHRLIYLYSPEFCVLVKQVDVDHRLMYLYSPEFCVLVEQVDVDHGFNQPNSQSSAQLAHAISGSNTHPVEQKKKQRFITIRFESQCGSLLFQREGNLRNPLNTGADHVHVCSSMMEGVGWGGCRVGSGTQTHDGSFTLPDSDSDSDSDSLYSPWE